MYYQDYKSTYIHDYNRGMCTNLGTIHGMHWMWTNLGTIHEMKWIGESLTPIIKEK